MRPAQPAALHQRFTPAPLALAAAMAIALAAGHVPLAHAQSGAATAAASPIAINIPAQPLGQALNELARQANLQMTFPAALVAGKQAPAVSGQLTVRQALDRLLTNNGLTSAVTGNAVVVREAPMSRTGEVTLPAVTVTAAGSSAGELSKPYAGGQVASGVGAGLLGQRSLQDLPFAAQSYTSNLVADRQMASLQELEKFNASVNSNFIQGVQGERLQDLNIRGFNATYLIDGVLAPLPLRANPEVYERIEVIKGVASSALSVQNGSTLLNVNLIPKRASATPLAEVTLRSYGGDAFGVAADVSRRFGADQEWGLRVNAANDGGETTIKGYKLDRQLLSAALDYQGEKLRGSLDLEYSRSAPKGFPVPAIEELGLQIPALPDRSRTTGQPWTRYPQTVHNAIARVEYDLLPQWTMGMVASAGNYRNRGISAGIALLQNDQGDTFFDTSSDVENGEARAIQVWSRSRFKTKVARHQVSLMAERSESSFESPSRSPIGCADNLYQRLPCPEPVPGPATQQFAGDQQRTGLVAGYELGLWDERALFTAALRHSKLSNDFQNIGAGTRSDFDGSATTPVLGVVIKPMAGISLFGNYAESLEFGRVAPNSAVNRGESTPPIAGKQLEFGAKFDSGSFGGELAWFRIQRDSAYTDPATNRFGLFGEQKHQGVEMTGYGEITSGWKLIAGATWIDAKYTAAQNTAVVGNRVFAVPKFRAVASLEVDFGKAFGVAPGLSLSSTLAHTGSVPFDLANTRDLPAFTTLDLGANYATRVAGRETVFRFAVRNATDKAYWTTNYIGGDLNPSVPRTLFANMSVRF